jgi:response regulator RpfG family c-di-GMP phosphodiesterase
VSDLRDRILALNGEANSQREVLEMAAQLAEAEDAKVREEVDFQRGIVRGLYQQIDEGNRRTARWTSRAIKAEKALTEANKLLEQTIEVLELYTALHDVKTLPYEYYLKAKPLLDNLKALKKEA